MAKEKQARRMIAMALAAAVTVTAVPVDALAASPYRSKVARMQAKNEAREKAAAEKMGRLVVTVEEVVEEAVTEEITAEEPVAEEPVTEEVPEELEGEEVVTEEKEAEEITIPVIGEDVVPDGETEDGKDIFTGSGEAADPVIEGDAPEGEEDEEWDYTETTETPREAEVIVGDVTVQTGSPDFVDENGNPVEREDEGFNYYWSDIYTVDGKSIIDGEVSSAYWTTGRVKAVLINADGTESEIMREGTCQRVVAHDNGTPDDYSDDYEIGGLYCTDMSTGIKQDLKYRRANLEDADYYTTEDAEHLRAIMTHGYTWNDDTDENGIMGDQNLENMKNMLTDAQTNGDDATKAMLAGIDFSTLTREQAATATGMAVWHYGNRVILEEGQTMELRSRDGNAVTAATIEAVYKYLITLEESAVNEDGSHKETQVINEEKFVEEMEVIIGSMVKDHENNQDADRDNDVYDVGLKFSLVVTPDKDNDDLVVKVLDNNGNEVKSARIAGTAAEGEDYLNRAEDGSYTMTGLKLQENSNATFNLKLEGYQLLEEGVYVFESQHLNQDEWVDRRVEYYKDNGYWEKELEASSLTEAEYKEWLATKYTPDAGESQNFIGKYSEEAEVDVSMEIDLSFNVDEGTITKKHSWKKAPHREPSYTENGGEMTETPEDTTIIPDENVPQTDLPQIDAPQTEGEELTEIEDGDIPLADAPEEGVEIADEEVPLADAEESIIAETGDSNHMAAGFAGMLAALAGMVGLKRRKEN